MVDDSVLTDAMHPSCSLPESRMPGKQETQRLLVSGGDTRIVPDTLSGKNKYGCSVSPDPETIPFGSSTGTAISERGYAAAHAMHQRLVQHLGVPLGSDHAQSQPASKAAATLYREEAERIRDELTLLCCGSEKSSDLSGVATILAASGTDCHLIAGQLVAGRPGGIATGGTTTDSVAGTATASAQPLRIIMMEQSETGSGVYPALGGYHFSDCSALRPAVPAQQSIEGAYPVEITCIRLRLEGGSARYTGAILGDIWALVQESMCRDQQVLLIAIDVSKTGLMAPGPDFLADLRQEFPDNLTILVDACQLRLSEHSVQGYLKLGCMVAITGSKFVTGPAFSGALLIPSELVPRLSRHTLPIGLRDYSLKADWPAASVTPDAAHWSATTSLCEGVNWGMLLRWEAALAELRTFRAIPTLQVHDFLQRFAIEVQNALHACPAIEMMDHFPLKRRVFNAMKTRTRSDSNPDSKTDWDSIPTIFPFLLYHCDTVPSSENGTRGRPLSRAQTQELYVRLQSSEPSIPIHPASCPDPSAPTQPIQLGQPVYCGSMQGVPVSALRLCASSRLVLEACSEGETSIRRVLARIHTTVHRITRLLSHAD